MEEMTPEELLAPPQPWGQRREDSTSKGAGRRYLLFACCPGVHSWSLRDHRYNPQHFSSRFWMWQNATELKHQLLAVSSDIISKSFIFSLCEFTYFVFILFGLKSLFSFSFQTKVFFFKNFKKISVCLCVLMGIGELLGVSFLLPCGSGLELWSLVLVPSTLYLLSHFTEPGLGPI